MHAGDARAELGELKPRVDAPRRRRLNVAGSGEDAGAMLDGYDSVNVRGATGGEAAAPHDDVRAAACIVEPPRASAARVSVRQRDDGDGILGAAVQG